MKKTLQRQGVLLALALVQGAMACGPREPSGNKGDQQPTTGEAAQTAKPRGITEMSEGPEPRRVDTVDLGRGVKMEFVWVPGGSFEMGSNEYDSEKPVHTVQLDGFWMGKYEVTQEQYEAVTGGNPSNFKGAKNPVERVSWNDAVAFCQKAGKGIRLPTEAEWEYACRAGSRTRFFFGDSDSGLGEYAWYRGNSGSQTHPVGQKKPNAWGLYDMHGNVCEWCGDWYGNYSSGSASNPQGASSGDIRVLRGGSWDSGPRICRSGIRGRYFPADTGGHDGFRVVCGGVSSR